MEMSAEVSQSPANVQLDPGTSDKDEKGRESQNGRHEFKGSGHRLRVLG